MHWLTILTITSLFITVVVLSASVYLQYQHRKGVENHLASAAKLDSSIAEPLESMIEDTIGIETAEGELNEFAGVLVEFRPHANIKAVVANFIEVIPDTPVYVYHGNANSAYVEEQLSGMMNVHTRNIGCDNINLTEYNHLCTKPEFYKSIPAQKFIMFQTDSILFSNSKVELDEFLEFDYVGAPWDNNFTARQLFNALVGHTVSTKALDLGGNGGLSLRDREKMIDITTKIPFLSLCQPQLVEDIYFAYAFEKYMEDGGSLHLPTREQAGRFSFESVYAGGEDVLPFGAHKHLPTKLMDQIEPRERQPVESY